jgi:hypothetical protein
VTRRALALHALLIAATCATGADAAPESRVRVATRGLVFGADAEWWRPVSGALSLGAQSSAAGFFSSSGPPAARGDALMRLGWTRGPTTLWAGVGAWRPSDTTLRATNGMVGVGAEVLARSIRWGASARRSSTAMPGEPYLVYSWTAPPIFQSPPDTIPTVPYWAYPGPQEVAVTTFEAGLEWIRPRWNVEGGLGVSVGRSFGPVHLGRIALTRWVGSSFGLRVGAHAGIPAWLSGDPDDVSHVELGVSFQPGRSAGRGQPTVEAGEPLAEAAHAADAGVRWETARVGDGVHVLRVHAPSATHVALRGDFTSWEWIALETDGGGWWKTTRALAPGAHQLEILADGRPVGRIEGLPRTTGDYGNEVGLFVVE